jgi:Phytanoyl-CoA dioxygenase (PhyH)
MNSPVSPLQRERFAEDGYAIFPSLLDTALVAEAGDHVTWLQRKHPDLRPEQLHHWLMWDDPFWLRLLADDRLLDIVEGFLGPDIALFASHYICKPGGDGLPVLWHQDGHYWPLDPMEVITVWLAVDDAGRENGCMRVIPGSHRERKLHPHLREEDRANVLSSRLEAAAVDESRAVDVEIPAGGISVHDPFLIHGSNPNHSPRRRCGLTIRYIPTTTRITREWKSFLLRGEDRHHRNDYHPFPPYREGDHFPFRDLPTYRGGLSSPPGAA